MTDLWHAVDQMEDPIRKVGEAASALRCIATSDSAPNEGPLLGAMFFIADQLEEVAKNLDRKQRETFELAKAARQDKNPCHLRAVKDDDGGAA